MLDALDHFQRHGRAAAETAGAAAEFRAWRAQVERAANHSALLGLEGTAARRWFTVLAAALPSGWSLPGRVKRPPTDPVNSLLSLGYTLLAQRLETTCRAWGLDPALGCLHAWRPGRPSLACDLMEPFRVPVVDRLLVAVLQQSRFTADDFQPGPGGGIRLQEAALRRWLLELETHLHAPRSGSSLQMQLVERVRRYAEDLPPLSTPPSHWSEVAQTPGECTFDT